MEKISDQQLLDELKLRFEAKENALKDLEKLNKQLINVNLKLKESEALKSHFISNITNELVNPFTSIHNLARNISKIGEGRWEKVLKLLSLIERESFVMDFQLKNIFAAAKIEAGETYPNFIKVDVCNVVEDLISKFESEAILKNIKISLISEIGKDCQSSVYFLTDLEYLSIIISNLLSNAIKFSFSDGEVFINVKILKDRKLVIRVSDKGEGVSEENQKLIFDRFKRVDSGINSINRGHGLGLSVNKAYIDLLDGHITMETALGEGSTFEVIIPEPNENSKFYSSNSNEIFFDENEGMFDGEEF